MIEVIEKDLLTVEEGIIAHQVNCQGVMGSGVALGVKRKFPEAYSVYRNRCFKHEGPTSGLLGKVDLVRVRPGLKIANVYAQDFFGGSVGQRHTDYMALAYGIRLLNEGVKYELEYGDPESFDFPTLYVPYLMGCDRGGGNWEPYSAILWGAYDGPVVACKLPENA